MKVDKCIHHATTYVLFGQSKGEDIVMKVKKPSDMKYAVQYFEGIITFMSEFDVIQDIMLIFIFYATRTPSMYLVVLF